MYQIGKVLYVVLSNKSQVYPMQVIEVITKKTLQGEETKYVLQAGSDKSTTVFLDQIDGEIFDSAEKARTTLVKRATNVVNKIIDAAVQKSKLWYPESVNEPQTIEDLPDFGTISSPNELVHDPESQTVMLPDGTVAKVKLAIPNS